MSKSVIHLRYSVMKFSVKVIVRILLLSHMTCTCDRDPGLFPCRTAISA